MIALVVVATTLFLGLVSSLRRTLVTTGDAAQPDRDAQGLDQRRLEPAAARGATRRCASSTASRATPTGEPLVSPELVVQPFFRTRRRRPRERAGARRRAGGARRCTTRSRSSRAACSSPSRGRGDRRPRRRGPLPRRAARRRARVRARALEGRRRLRVGRLVVRERGLGRRARARERREARRSPTRACGCASAHGADLRRARAPHRRRPALRARGAARDRVLREAGGVGERALRARRRARGAGRASARRSAPPTRCTRRCRRAPRRSARCARSASRAARSCSRSWSSRSLIAGARLRDRRARSRGRSAVAGLAARSAASASAPRPSRTNVIQLRVGASRPGRGARARARRSASSAASRRPGAPRAAPDRGAAQGPERMAETTASRRATISPRCASTAARPPKRAARGCRRWLARRGRAASLLAAALSSPGARRSGRSPQVRGRLRAALRAGRPARRRRRCSRARATSSPATATSRSACACRAASTPTSSTRAERVEKGQPLVQLDARDYEAALARGARRARSARARERRAAPQGARAHRASLRAQDVASQSELDVKENELRVAAGAGRRSSQRRDRAGARSNLDYTVAARADATA